MNKKQIRKERQRRRRKATTFGRPVLRTVRIATSFSRKHWLAIAGILLPVVASFIIYYMSFTEPDIRFTGSMKRGTEVDSRVRDNKYGISYQKGVFRFKNFSFRSGYVDRVEFIPASLSSNLTVTILDLEKIRIGWREEKEVEIKWIVTVDVRGVNTEYDQGTEAIIMNAKFYDNTGKQIPDLHGHAEFLRVTTAVENLEPKPQPTK